SQYSPLQPAFHLYPYPTRYYLMLQGLILRTGLAVILSFYFSIKPSPIITFSTFPSYKKRILISIMNSKKSKNKNFILCLIAYILLWNLTLVKKPVMSIPKNKKTQGF